MSRAGSVIDLFQVGTSFGVSTIYLALAVHSNLQLLGGKGTVIATEYEPSKVKVAQDHWREAGEEVAGMIDLRAGDLRDTLPSQLPALDLVLLDSESRAHLIYWRNGG